MSPETIPPVNTLPEVTRASANAVSARYHEWRASRLESRIQKIDLDPATYEPAIAEAEREQQFYSSLGKLARGVVVEEQDIMPNLPAKPIVKDAFTAQADFWDTVGLVREFGTTTLDNVPFDRLPADKQAERINKERQKTGVLSDKHPRNPDDMTLSEKMSSAEPPKTKAERKAQEQLVTEIAEIRQRRVIQKRSRGMHGTSGERFATAQSYLYRKQLDQADKKAYKKGDISYSELDKSLKSRLTVNGRTAQAAHGNIFRPAAGIEQRKTITKEAHQLDKKGHGIVERMKKDEEKSSAKLVKAKNALQVQEKKVNKLTLKRDKHGTARSQAKDRRDYSMEKLEQNWERRMQDTDFVPIYKRTKS